MNFKMPGLILSALLLAGLPPACQAAANGGWLKIEHVGESDRPVHPLWLTSRTLFVRRPATVAPLSASEFERLAEALLKEGTESSAPSPQTAQGSFQWTLLHGESQKAWITGPQDSGRLLGVLRGNLPSGRPGLEKSVMNLLRLTSAND